MKKRLSVLVLSSAILLSACSSGQNAATTTTQNETSVAATEATTTTEETTTEPVVKANPEDYAEIYYKSGSMDAPVPLASGFEFVDAELYKDANNVLYYPNYSSGKDIVIRFKSDKKLKYGSISQYESSKRYDDNFMMSGALNYWSGNIARLEESKGKYTSNISSFLSSEEGVYTLTIPAKYAKTDNQFYIQLFTDYKIDEDGNDFTGDLISFSVRCEKETAVAIPTFTPEQHGVWSNEVDATDFEFVNAKLPVFHDNHSYCALPPEYPANQDIVIRFKCKSKVLLASVDMGNVNEESIEHISDTGFLTSENGIYTLTIPAKYALPDRTFSIGFVEGLGFTVST